MSQSNFQRPEQPRSRRAISRRSEVWTLVQHELRRMDKDPPSFAGYGDREDLIREAAEAHWKLELLIGLFG